MNKKSLKLDIRGIHYHVEVSGNGSPLWLLHGFTGSTETWKKLIPMINKHRTIVVIDLIGHGQTDCPSNFLRYRMEEQVLDLEEIRKELNHTSIELLGYSMGGRVALSYAVNFKENVKKLILESSSPGLETEEERNQRKKNDLILSNRIKQEGLEAFVDYWQDIPLFQTQKRLSKETQIEIRSERLSQNPVGLANSLVGMGTGSQPSWWGEIKHLDIPILLITGSKDEKFVRISQKMIKELPKANQINVFDAGHAIHVEVPEKFAKIVREFVLST